MKPTRIHFVACLEELPKMLAWIRDHLSRSQIESKAVRKIELAAEEALANIIRHAYQEKGGQVELQFHRLPTHVEIVFMDQGPPFNPLEEGPAPDLSSPLEERDPGGLGVFLMRNAVDEILYTREKEMNVLIFKHFSRTR